LNKLLILSIAKEVERKAMMKKRNAPTEVNMRD
jgi:hypothetical protein